MLLKATVQKQSYKQSLPKVSSETAVSRYSLKYLFFKISQYLQEKTHVGVSSINLQAFRDATLQLY